MNSMVGRRGRPGARIHGRLRLGPCLLLASVEQQVGRNGEDVERGGYPNTDVNFVFGDAQAGEGNLTADFVPRFLPTVLARRGGWPSHNHERLEPLGASQATGSRLGMGISSSTAARSRPRG